MLLWEEFIKEHPDGLRYTQFCERHRAFQKSLKTHLRQEHVGGEKAFVDYSGLRPSIVDFETGEVTPVELFVFCWGASHCLYVEAQENQSLPNFVMGHVRAFEFFGCVPRIVVPDNLKAAVTKAHRYDPDVNPTYCALSEHYGFAPLPARPYSPKDKAKVEVGVQIIQRWIVARLRNHIFHTVNQLNASIRELLLSLNQRPLRQLKKARWDLFLEWDLPNALPLPKERFLFHTWQKAKVGIDYCVQVDKHYYSVPYIHVGKDADVKLAEGNVEVFLKGERIAFHRKNEKAYGHTMDPQHMPEKHRQHLAWTPHRILGWAEKTGPNTRRLIEKLMSHKPHSESFGKERLENAAKMALQGSFYRVAQIAQILKRGLDRLEEEQPETKSITPSENIRGSLYFQERMGL
jgi:transposase